MDLNLIGLIVAGIIALLLVGFGVFIYLKSPVPADGHIAGLTEEDEPEVDPRFDYAEKDDWAEEETLASRGSDPGSVQERPSAPPNTETREDEGPEASEEVHILTDDLGPYVDLDFTLDDITHSGWLDKDDRVDDAFDVLFLLVQEELHSVHGIGPDRVEQIFSQLPVRGNLVFFDDGYVIEGLEIEESAINDPYEPVDVGS